MKKSLIFLALVAGVPALFAQDQAAKLALAREAITAMQADKMLDVLSSQMKQMAAQQSQLAPTASDEERQLAAELQAQVLDLAMTEAKATIAKMDAIYAEVYSDAELKAMIGFFGSPEGRSMVAKQPQIVAKVMPLVQQMQQELAPKVRSLVEASKAKAAAAKAAATPPAVPAPEKTTP